MNATCLKVKKKCLIPKFDICQTLKFFAGQNENFPVLSDSRAVFA